MSPEQKTLVKETWRQLGPISGTAAELFYARLFLVDPTARPLFTGADPAEQRRKLVQALTAVVQGLDDFETLVPTLTGLGVRHARYGVTDAHYEKVGEALLWALEQGLARQWTQEAKIAWSGAYSVIADVMRKAAAKDEKPGG
jgi:hemoglobin-like flavoprotein